MKKAGPEKIKTVKGAVKAAEKAAKANKVIVEEEKKGEVVVAAKNTGSLNNQIIEQVDRLMKYYQTQGDKGRMYAYRKAVTTLKSIDFDIIDGK
jgi:F0F1-type ATP synthase gamma subunit